MSVQVQVNQTPTRVRTGFPWGKKPVPHAPAVGSASFAAVLQEVTARQQHNMVQVRTTNTSTCREVTETDQEPAT